MSTVPVVVAGSTNVRFWLPAGTTRWSSSTPGHESGAHCVPCCCGVRDVRRHADEEQLRLQRTQAGETLAGSPWPLVDARPADLAEVARSRRAAAGAPRRLLHGVTVWVEVTVDVTSSRGLAGPAARERENGDERQRRSASTDGTLLAAVGADPGDLDPVVGGDEAVPPALTVLVNIAGAFVISDAIHFAG